MRQSTGLKEESAALPRQRRIYWACLLLALLARCAFVAFSDPHSIKSRWTTVTDAALYDRFGWNLASEGTLGSRSSPSAFCMPAYPIFLAAAYSIAGHLPGAVRLAQVLVGLATIFLLGRMARCLGGRNAELLAVAIGAIYPYFIYYTGEILTETLFIFALSGALLSAALVGHHGRLRDGVLHGLFAAVLVMTRPTGVFLELGILILARPWTKERRRRRSLALLAAAVLVALTWSPWIIRNRRVFGETVLLDTHGGWGLYTGQLLSRQVSLEEINARVGYSHLSIYEGTLPGGPQGELREDRRCKREAIEMIRADIPAFLRTVLHNASRLWISLDMRDAARAGGGGFLTLVGWLSYFPLLILGLAGLWQLGRTARWVPLAAVVAVFGLSTALHGIVLGGQRYRVATIDPFLLVLASWEATVLGAAFLARRGEQSMGIPSPGGRTHPNPHETI
ncbi:MAG TPA: glycosyltransferase family 39 protein [Candidatus Polarisedimenticolia bacterium]|nr:glycosyltransferase family 39 protein [Candidatus Polarisedimenticolia bacterium]